MSSIHTECSYSERLPQKRKREKRKALKVSAFPEIKNTLPTKSKDTTKWNRDDILSLHACAAIRFNQRNLAESNRFFKKGEFSWKDFISLKFIEHKSLGQIETKIKVTKDLDKVLSSFWEKHKNIKESSITSLFHTVKTLMKEHIVKEYENKFECPSLHKVTSYLFKYKNNREVQLCSENSEIELADISSHPRKYQTLEIEVAEEVLRALEEIQGPQNDRIKINYDTIANYFIHKIIVEGEVTEKSQNVLETKENESS